MAFWFFLLLVMLGRRHIKGHEYANWQHWLSYWLEVLQRCTPLAGIPDWAYISVLLLLPGAVLALALALLGQWVSAVLGAVLLWLALSGRMWARNAETRSLVDVVADSVCGLFAPIFYYVVFGVWGLLAYVLLQTLLVYCQSHAVERVNPSQLAQYHQWIEWPVALLFGLVLCFVSHFSRMIALWRESLSTTEVHARQRCLEWLQSASDEADAGGRSALIHQLIGRVYYAWTIVVALAAVWHVLFPAHL